MTNEELIEIATKAERYNGAGRDTVLKLIIEIRKLQNQLKNKLETKKEQD